MITRAINLYQLDEKDLQFMKEMDIMKECKMF